MVCLMAIEVNAVGFGVASVTAQQKTGDSLGVQKLEKSLNHAEENSTETAQAVSRAEETAESSRNQAREEADRMKSEPSHLGQNVDTVA